MLSSYQTGIRARVVLGMVKFKMENKMEGLEKEMGIVKEDLGNLKEYLLEL